MSSSPPLNAAMLLYAMRMVGNNADGWEVVEFDHFISQTVVEMR